MANPMKINTKAVFTAREAYKEGRSCCRSAIFSVPVLMYKYPIPKRKNEAPMVPMTKYRKPATAAFFFPMATSAYPLREATSSNTNRLNISPVIAIPRRPVMRSR